MTTNIVGTGIALSFGTSNFSAELTSIPDFSGITRQAIETTILALTTPSSPNFGNRTFIPSIAVDPGEMSATFKCDPDITPLINQAPETITLTWPLQTGQATSTVWTMTGFCTDYSLSGMALDELVIINMKIKITGQITVTVST